MVQITQIKSLCNEQKIKNYTYIGTIHYYISRLKTYLLDINIWDHKPKHIM